jgi:uncharacterized protein
MISPCISNCQMNPLTRLCNGCGRTLDEIAAWTKMTDQERQIIMEQLKQRL